MPFVGQTCRMDLVAYLEVRDRIDRLVREVGAEPSVRTCPGWTVRDVVAHLTGLCEDWVDGRLDGYGSEAWTAAQIARFADASVDEILDRWHIAAARFAALDDDPIMGPPGRWAFGDAVTHEADIRGALHAGRVPHDAVLLALKGAIARWRQVLADANTPTLLLRATDARSWWLGQPDDPDATSAETTAYDIFRALAGRRSKRQVRAWHWTGTPDPFVNAGVPYPFSWADDDVLDD